MRRRLHPSIAAWLCAASTAFAQMPAPPGGGGASGDGIWRRNAYYGEAQTFDYCFGHQPGNGNYHHHSSPPCLRYQLNDNITLVRTTRNGPIFAEAAVPTKHSPILGWAADGFPIYGPYGYSNPSSATSPIKLLRSSFSLRNITTRTSLPLWSLPNHTGLKQSLSATQFGPAVSTLYPLGRYVEDYEFMAGSGDLDAHNGRFEVTPDYPKGIYAYHVTINPDGSPAFPYIFGATYAGTPGFATITTIPAGATLYSGGSVDARLASWITNTTLDATVISGYDPSKGAATTWPSNIPKGALYSGGTSTGFAAELQKVQYTSSDVYVTGFGLPAFTVGPWFDATASGGVFSNFPSKQSNFIFPFSRSPAQTSASNSVGLGPVGIFVDGVAAYNFLDGASYSHASAADIGGGTVTPTAYIYSQASQERGPAAPGSLVNANAIYGATLATLAGATTIGLTDSTGKKFTIPKMYASPDLVEFQVPSTAATGFANVTFTQSGKVINAHMTILQAYPNLYTNSTNIAEGSIQLTHNGLTTTSTLLNGTVPSWGSGDKLVLIIQGSGAGGTKLATATIGTTNVTVTSVTTQTTTPGVDYYTLQIPNSLNGSGKKPLTITVATRPSNSVTLNFTP